MMKTNEAKVREHAGNALGYLGDAMTMKGDRVADYAALADAHIRAWRRLLPSSEKASPKVYQQFSDCELILMVVQQVAWAASERWDAQGSPMHTLGGGRQDFLRRAEAALNVIIKRWENPA